MIERERDRWQRPSEILRALNLRDGAAVVDLGSGAGYFALKLSSAVGRDGRVFAVDTCGLPLVFLRLRALSHNRYNIHSIHCEPDDPHLPDTVDAVLVLNTYHELAHPKSTLEHVFRSLVAGGRLVVVDRHPDSSGNRPEIHTQHQQIPFAQVEGDLLQTGFEVIYRQSRFAGEPGAGLWWLIIGSKPGRNTETPGTEHLKH